MPALDYQTWFNQNIYPQIASGQLKFSSPTAALGNANVKQNYDAYVIRTQQNDQIAAAQAVNDTQNQATQDLAKQLGIITDTNKATVDAVTNDWPKAIQDALNKNNTEVVAPLITSLADANKQITDLTGSLINNQQAFQAQAQQQADDFNRRFGMLESQNKTLSESLIAAQAETKAQQERAINLASARIPTPNPVAAAPVLASQRRSVVGNSSSNMLSNLQILSTPGKGNSLAGLQIA